MSKDSKNAGEVRRTSRVAFGMVDAQVIRDPSLPAATKNVYAYLATYCSDVRSAFPSRATMARQLGVSVRTVDTALRAGEHAGLWTIRTRYGGDGRQTSNLYELHDLGGGYVIGSGSRGAKSAPSPGQNLHGAPAKSAPNQDHVNETSQRQTTSTSSDAASGAPRTSSQGDEDAPQIKIYPGRGMDKWAEDADVIQYLVGAAIKAMKTAGLQPAENAADQMGYTLKHKCEGMTRDKMLENVERWVNLAGTEDPGCGWLATRDPWADAA